MRLIDEDAIREKVMKVLECIGMPSDDCLIENCPYEKFGPALCLQQLVKDAIAFLKEQKPPTVDAVPVKHGRWIYKPNVYDDSTYECSECGEPWTLIEGTPQENGMKYCPNCGAKMDLEEEENHED